MKRLLGLLLVMGMVGCGGGDDAPPAGEDALQATPTKTQAKVDEQTDQGSPGKNSDPILDWDANGNIEAVHKHLTVDATAN